MPGPFSVLICDDSIGFPTLVQTWLSGDGRFDVVGRANGGEEAKEMVAAQHPDLLLLDLLLPDVPSTPVLVGALRALHPGLRIVLVSSMMGERLQQAGAEAGVEAVCNKAATSAELAECLYSVAVA